MQLAAVFHRGRGTYHLLGTDALGRDHALTHYVWRAVSLVGVTVVAVAGLIWCAAWALPSGFFGSWRDTLVMRLVDIQLAVPFILLAIATMAVLGTGLWNVVFVLGF